MAWIGANAAAKQAAKQGMNTILSPQIPYYINRKQSKLPTEPMSQGHGTETVEAVYNYQPLKDVDAALQPYYKRCTSQLLDRMGDRTFRSPNT